MLVVNKEVQDDTLGSNIVEQLPALVYEQIMTGALRLWDSPKKEIEINSATLQSIEKSSNTHFSQTGKFFIYEMWAVHKKDIQCKTLGFSFTNINDKKEAISYGYVDYNDVATILKSPKVQLNANGSYGTTFEQLLEFKKYNYAILQYGDRIIKSIQESEQIKQETFRDKKWLTSTPSIKNIKWVAYTIEQPKSLDDERGENTKRLFNSIATYLTENTEDFLNIGGEKITNNSQNKSIHVNKIEITSLWKKEDENISCDFLNFTIYVNDVALNPLLLEDVLRWGIVINFKSIEDFLKENKCYSVMTQINDQKIKPNNSEKYSKALNNYNWSQLTEF